MTHPYLTQELARLRAIESRADAERSRLVDQPRRQRRRRTLVWLRPIVPQWIYALTMRLTVPLRELVEVLPSRRAGSST